MYNFFIIFIEGDNLKIKEIRLLNITVLQNNIEIYNGPVQEATEELLDTEIKKIHFDEDSNLIIEI